MRIVAFLIAGTVGVAACGMSAVAEERKLSRNDVCGLVAAQPPSPISPLFGVVAGDAKPSQADPALRQALCDPDEVWMLRRETELSTVSGFAFFGGKVWSLTFATDGLGVGDAAPAARPSAFVAKHLALAGSDVSLEATGDVGKEEFTALRALDETADRPAPGLQLAALAEKRGGQGATSTVAALERLAERGWVRLAQSRPEPLWEVLRPAAVRALVRPAETLQVRRLVRGQREARYVLFQSSQGGTLAVLGSSVIGLTAPRTTAAATIFSQLESEPQSTTADGTPATAPSTTPATAIGLAAREQPSGNRIGDAIRQELEHGNFRTAAAVYTREVWGRGKPDLWAICTRGDKQVNVEYEDTSGDDVPDVVRVKDYPGGPFTRSFIQRNGKWEESNILEAHLEITFKLPWAREAYHKHNVNVILNDHVIAQLTDVIPEGVYRFPVRPQDLKVDANASSANDVRLETTHLRGGHYVVSGDFSLSIRLAQVSQHVIADSPEQAEQILRSSAQLRAAGIDLAVYANGWRAVPPAPRLDEPVALRGEVFNLGMETAHGWKIQFHDGDPAHGGKPVAELPLVDVEPGAAVPVEGKWKASPGEHRIFVTVIAPDGVKDVRESNNQTSLLVAGGGDTIPPSLLIAEPADGAAVVAGKVVFRGTATDNVAVAALEYSVDGGLWVAVELKERWEATLDLPTGAHQVRFRARDTSGLVTEQSRAVKVN